MFSRSEALDLTVLINQYKMRRQQQRQRHHQSKRLENGLRNHLFTYRNTEYHKGKFTALCQTGCQQQTIAPAIFDDNAPMAS